ncbi:MAG: hypothetical protein ABSG92_02685 [Conexivisphaerales archaeon]
MSPFRMATSEVSEVERYVREKFNVKEVYYKGSDALEFSIAEGDAYKEKFEDLVRFLRPKGLLPALRSTDGGLALYIESTRGRLKRKMFLPVIFFVATILTVTVDGWIRAYSLTGSFSSSRVLLDTALYAIFIMAFLGSRAAVHYMTCRRDGRPLPTPYFVPGFPTVMPTFGAVYVPAEPAVNRDSQFELEPLATVAGLAVAALALGVGLLDTQVLTQQAAAGIFGANLTLVPLQVPAGIQLLIGSYLHPASQSVVVLSPLVYASWICFMISFVSIIPSRQLDGGNTASAVLSARNLTIAVLVTLFVVVFVDLWMAFFLFFVSWSTRTLQPLDSVSRTSRRNVYLYVALLCVAAVVYLVLLYPPLPTTY